MPEMLEYLSVFIGYCNFHDEYASVIFYANCSLLLFMAYVNNSPNLINGIYRQLIYYIAFYAWENVLRLLNIQLYILMLFQYNAYAILTIKRHSSF